jgi:uncharacterized protein
MLYNVKSISAIKVDGNLAITNIDTKARTVEGYFSVFGVVDSDGDMIMPGAYTKTLKENGSRIKHLWQHDPRYPLARPELKEDGYGLKFRSVISDTTFGRDAIKLYEDGVIDEHSVGFQTIKQQKRDQHNEMTELRLWEGSSVTWGANSLSRGGMAKSMGAIGKEEIIKRMDAVYKALRHGRYESEEIFEQLDIYHQQLKQLILDLSDTTPAADKAREPMIEGEENAIKEITSLIQLFK